MNPFRAKGAPCKVRQEGNRIIFENDYQIWVHDLNCGGELTEAIVKNGSGKNLLRAPQCSLVGLVKASSYYNYSTAQIPAVKSKIDETPVGPRLTIVQKLADAKGNILPDLTIEHEIIYHAWGYAEHKLNFKAAKRIEAVGQLQIGSFFTDPDFDGCVIRESQIANSGPWGSNGGTFKPMTGGASRSDCPVHSSRYLPLSVILFKRGIEGIEFSLSDDVKGWDDIVVSPLHWQLCYLSFSRAKNAYEMRFSPLDVLQDNQYIEKGSHKVGFRVAMPFIKRKIVPLRPCAGNVLYSQRGFANRWPVKADIEAWKEAGVTLMRVHNDGDSFDNGIFWRDAAYPPYPPEEMAKLDATLEECNKQGINVVPYFSVKEFHPAAADYKENAENWGRKTVPDSPLMLNRSRGDYFGAQMCLESGWAQKRRDSIDLVLKNHAFHGVYFDWCAGSECQNPAHSEGRHWDNDKLQEHLEWSYKRSGANGEVYLHLTHTPNLAAENLASLVLTEEAGYAKLCPEMFSPHVHFMNIAPRQICDMLPGSASAAEHRILALAALLHHATISSVNPAYLDFYKEIETLRNEVVNYTRHSAPGEGLVKTDYPQIGASIYWNEKEILLLLANLSEESASTSWEISSKLTGATLSGRDMLKGLELKILKFPVSIR